MKYFCRDSEQFDHTVEGDALETNDESGLVLIRKSGNIVAVFALPIFIIMEQSDDSQN